MTDSADPYESDVCGWWHRSEPSPELLEALADGWISPPGNVVDLGCGLGVEARHLADLGFRTLGVDISAAALRQAGQGPTRARFLQADVTHLPLRSASVRFLLDRGCFHYLAAEERAAYEREAQRVLIPGGRLLLRACPRAAGVRNDIDESLLRKTFADWDIVQMNRAWIPSDTRTMEAVITRLQR